MSNLRNRLAGMVEKENGKKKILKKIAIKTVKSAIKGDFYITNYSLDNNKYSKNIMFELHCDDEAFKGKFVNNKLSETERMFLANTCNEYFCDKIKTDDNLFYFGVYQIIEPILLGDKSQLSGVVDKYIDKEFILEHGSQKNQKTKEMAFSKYKFTNLPLSEQIKAISDCAEFFSDVWGDDISDPRLNINNYVRLDTQPKIEELDDDKDE